MVTLCNHVMKQSPQGMCLRGLFHYLCSVDADPRTRPAGRHRQPFSNPLIYIAMRPSCPLSAPSSASLPLLSSASSSPSSVVPALRLGIPDFCRGLAQFLHRVYQIFPKGIPDFACLPMPSLIDNSQFITHNS